MTTGFCFDEGTLWHVTGEALLFLPPGRWLQPTAGGRPAERPKTKRRFMNLLDIAGLSRRRAVETAPPAADEALRRVRSDACLTAFWRLSRGEGGMLGEETPFGHGGFGIAVLSAGLAIPSMGRVLGGRWANGYALPRPPRPHCMPDHSMRFCLFANLPVAFEEMKARHGPGRVAGVDRDVHLGNGTQAIHWDRPEVRTLSLHQNARTPPRLGTLAERGDGKGEGANLNIPPLPGGGHESDLAAMDRIVLPAHRGFTPELIVVASGPAANPFDPPARMMAHSGTFRAMTQRLMLAASELCAVRIVPVHEGGPSETQVPFCGPAIMETLSGEVTEGIDPFLEPVLKQQPPVDVVALENRRLRGMAEAFGLQEAA